MKRGGERMAEKNFMEFLAEVAEITDEYSSLIIESYDNNTSLLKDARALNRLHTLRKRLDLLDTSIAKLPDSDDREIASRHIATIQHAVKATLCSIARHGYGKDSI